MSETRVAIDLDGTLRGFHQKAQALAEERLGVTENLFTDWSKMWNVYHEDKPVGAYIFNGWAQECFEQAPPLKGALAGYAKFVKNPHMKVWIVTTQSKDNEIYSTRWVEKYLGGYEDILFLRDKTKAPCNVLLDDKPENVDSYAKKARMGFLIDQPWNKEADVMRRVKTVKEAYDQLRQYV